MVVLYEHPLSPYAQKVKIALGEKGISFESRLPDLLGGNLAEFAPLNPRLEVPSLVDGEVRAKSTQPSGRTRESSHTPSRR